MSRVDFPHKAQIIHRQFTRPSARVSSRLLNAVALSLPKSRFLSSATTDEGSRTASPLSKENIISKRLATRNLLKNVKSVLPTAFPADRQDLAEVWSTRLDSAFADLAVTRGTRIAVWGSDPESSRNIVTALLEDPLSIGNQYRDSLTTRYNGETDSEGSLHLRYGESNQGENHELLLKSPWLYSSNAEIIEVYGRNDERILNHLLAADIVLLTTTTLMLLSDSLLRSLLVRLSAKQNVYLVIDGPSISSASYIRKLESFLFESLRQVFSELPHLPLVRLRVVSSEAALDSLASLRDALEKGTSPSAKTAATEMFQKTFLESRLSELSSSLSSTSTSFNNEEQQYNRQGTVALYAASVALDMARGTTLQAKLLVEEVQERRTSLQRTMSAEADMAMESAFGDGKTVREALEKSRKEIAKALDAFQWWKLPWRVDDLAADLKVSVQRGFVKDLERSLVYQTGILSATQSKLSSMAMESVTFPPSSPFDSAVARNNVAQVSMGTPLETTSLISPINTRLAQLIGQTGIISLLHVRAQNLLLQSYAISVGGIASSWASWMAGYVEHPTAVGLSALGIVASLRWTVGRWKRANKRWWEDWDRVGDGLERDLKKSVEDAVREKVLKQPAVARKNLKDLIHRRQEELRKVDSELETLEKELKALSSVVSHPQS